uniref:Uncharacterized protein n=1 Tax=Peronospora matthiolae TaxID=2874970 RepID=A0AAV1ULN8_9STRA
MSPKHGALRGDTRDGAYAEAAPATGHERVSEHEDYEEKSKQGVAHAVDNAVTRSGDASELLVSMTGITGRLDRLEESQTRLIKAEEGRGRHRDAPMTPPRIHVCLFRLWEVEQECTWTTWKGPMMRRYLLRGDRLKGRCRLVLDSPNIMDPARTFAVKLHQDLEFLICCPKLEDMGTCNIPT